ncbi:FAD/NAD(P)-binding protein [Labrys wisconsinensis]|uniref:NAD(P)/FAD-binding protein YdhS n=1 Tax=Labrys wisconsinensis TaxID=425677 RepID=A0ABU0JJK4_9HYPH|nr:FAD/NAD(P)-binding protein [Labrys wisconsinensis]MDQ0474459.1 putative NAD(P)/FAD-binding protein YdhS [Labrys wisconsinensis]
MIAGPVAQQPLRIAVVGCGFTGAAFIVHALRSLPGPLALEVVEPAAELGLGVAYAATDPLHRINVPSDRMSLHPEDPGHATRWLFQAGILPGDGASTDAAGHHYVPRRAYGAYVGDVLAEALRQAGPRVRLRHHRAVALGARALPDWSLRLSDGTTVAADRLVLSFGHGAPAAPFPIAPEAAADPRLIANPWQPDAVAALDGDTAVLIVGTGLTMADMVETLLARGHRGPITAVSRRGLIAQPQGLYRDDFDLLEGGPPPSTALALLRLARRRAAAASRAGLGWAPAADALRFELPRLWPALPAAERRRVVQRLLPFWESHRFRMAPQPHRTLSRAVETGRVRVERAGVRSVEVADGRLVATLRRPGGALESAAFGGIVLCIGPDRDPTRHPLVRDLVAAGLARLDALGIGLDVDQGSRLLDRDGRAQAGALALGPMTRGTFGEMTGAPDIVRRVAALAPTLAP